MTPGWADSFATGAGLVTGIAIVAAGTAVLCAGAVYVLTKATDFILEAVGVYSDVLRWVFATQGGRRAWIVVPKDGFATEVARLQAELDHARSKLREYESRARDE